MPWYIKLAISLGAIGLVLNALTLGVPRAVAICMPWVISAVDWLFAWLKAHPSVQAAVFANKDKIKALLEAIVAGVEQILDAAEKEAEKDLDQTQDPPPPPPPASGGTSSAG